MCPSLWRSCGRALIWPDLDLTEPNASDQRVIDWRGGAWGERVRPFMPATPRTQLRVQGVRDVSRHHIGWLMEMGGIEPPTGFARSAWSERCVPGRAGFRVPVVDRECPLLTCVTRPFAAPSALFPPSSRSRGTPVDLGATRHSASVATRPTRSSAWVVARFDSPGQSSGASRKTRDSLARSEVSTSDILGFRRRGGTGGGPRG